MSDALIKQYEQMHRNGLFNGISLGKEVPRIIELINLHKPQSILDYGCGKAKSYGKKGWGIETHFYDPAVPKFSTLPKKPVDAVICIDVAEHLPEDEIDDLIRNLMHYANMFVYMTICTRPANKRLPDGRNCHLTVKEPDWWRQKILSITTDIPIFYLRFNE